MDSVGSYEAKTHLPQLLKRAAQGEEFTITGHGKPVARLVPVIAAMPKLDFALAPNHVNVFLRSPPPSLSRRMRRRILRRAIPTGSPSSTAPQGTSCGGGSRAISSRMSAISRA